MVSWFLLLLPTLLASVAAPLDIRVVAESESFTAVLSGAMPAAPAGALSGSLSLNGSSSEVPITGVVHPSAQRVDLSVKVKYRDVPEDWVNRLRAADFDYRLRCRLAGARDMEWSGTKRWDQVEVEGREAAASGFVKLGSIELTEFSLLESTARADVTVRNPFSFPLKLASASYRLLVNGREVGSGATRGTTLRAEQRTTLNLPIDLDHGQLLAAAGSTLGSSGQVEGRLRGNLVVRLPGGDIQVPIDLSGRFSLLP
jgi:LEA14-like dessication related protein